MNKQTFGRIGESFAERWLKSRGYGVITANYKGDGGEIDLIAVKRRTLVFVEVKTKSSLTRGEPASHFTPQKAAAMRRAARLFTKTAGYGGRVRSGALGLPFYRRYKKIRFDLIELLIKDGKDARLIHTKDVIKTEN